DSLAMPDELETQNQDAIRAVQSLAEAREQVESSNLLKGEFREDEQPTDADAEELPASLRLRFDLLTSQLEEEFEAHQFVFFDDLGNELFRSGAEVDALTSEPSPWRLLENQLSPGVAQVKSGEEDRWTCFVRGKGPASHIALRFVLDGPVEAAQLLRLPGLLSEALYQSNPLET
ncbi:MAG: hypothetical protein AAF491_11255, partial [Verrucomicrobiota bacterium]